MNIHDNAKLTPKGRERMVLFVLSGQTLKAVSRAVGVCPRTVRKWVDRYKEQGFAGLYDRSSRPKNVYQPTPQHVKDEIIALRRQRLTGKHIAAHMNVSRASVSRILKAAGLSKGKDLIPAEPIRRYERATPGDLIHLDIKKLGRFERPGHRVTGDRTGQSTPRSGKKKGYGWEYVHVCIDDHSRVAYTDIFPDEKAVSAVAHLKAAIAYYRKMGVKVQRVMTDNGSCYKSRSFAKACQNWA